ncbi:MAG TPA: hypothetical protein VEU96_23265 [Bryobacteraceae bacterium]|nr:hypothetical protein [Bryobacteraceae bacterium]
MPDLVRATRWAMIILLGGLMVVVILKILTRGINMSGLLEVKHGVDKESFSPARVQMLMATVLAGMYYLLQVINDPAAGSLPDPPIGLVAVLGGSHAIYLGGKVQSVMSGNRKKTEPK